MRLVALAGGRFRPQCLNLRIEVNDSADDRFASLGSDGHWQLAVWMMNQLAGRRWPGAGGCASIALYVFKVQKTVKADAENDRIGKISSVARQRTPTTARR
jgi:hypothetical protein